MYVYTRVDSEQTSSGITPNGLPWTAIVPIVEETWVSSDGSGRTRSVTGKPRFLGERDLARWEAAGSPGFVQGTEDSILPPGSFPYLDVNAFPTRPNELLSRLRRDVAAEDLPSNVAVLVRIAELLARGDGDAGIRAALFRAAAALPGIEMSEQRTDPVGRSGVAVSITYDQSGRSCEPS